MYSFLLIAAVVLETSQNGIDLKIESDRTVVDPGRSVFLTVTMKTPADVKASLPDLRDRVRGFSLAEEYAGKPVKNADGSLVETFNWKLVPEPCAEVYKIAPFAVTASPKLMSARSDEGKFSFVAGPVVFENPPARETVTGEMEADPKKDLPPLSWKLVGWCAALLLAAGGALALAWFLLRYIARRVKEHRYVQRKYGIKAPHLTTEEFFEEIGARGMKSEDLRRFLESADLVKFAGVQATPEMADEATDSARGYLKGDSASAV